MVGPVAPDFQGLHHIPDGHRQVALGRRAADVHPEVVPVRPRVESHHPVRSLGPLAQLRDAPVVAAAPAGTCISLDPRIGPASP
jgi:hypothetical protein